MEAVNGVALEQEQDSGLPAGNAAEVEPSEGDELDPIRLAESAPQQHNRPIKRWKNIPERQLFSGNLVLDCPVPQRPLNQVPHSQPPERDEFTHVRYSAVTCYPSQFRDDRYTLRPRIFAKPRHIEIMVGVTLHNEDDILCSKTLSGIFKNIAHLQSRQKSRIWGPKSWKKIYICVISSGLKNVNPRTLALLAGLGIYQEGIAKRSINGKDIVAHLYEYTTQLSVSIRGGNVSLEAKDAIRCQMLFCHSAKAMNRFQCHRWFFQAFCGVINPNVCIMLDAGTRPGPVSIYNMWRAMDIHTSCGTTIGQVNVELKRGCRDLLSPLIAVQHFECNMRNLLGRPFESIFGLTYDTGDSFCGYRYVALQGHFQGVGPLSEYFAVDDSMTSQPKDWFSNKYLTRLSFEVVTKRHCSWKLKYVPSSRAETDCQDSMFQYLLQHQRLSKWNFSSTLYALRKSLDIFRSGHCILQKAFLSLQNLHQLFKMLIIWFSMGNLFLAFHILVTALHNDYLLGNTGYALGAVFEYLYVVMLLASFILALGNRLNDVTRYYTVICLGWIAVTVYMIFALIFLIIKATLLEMQLNITTASLFTRPFFLAMVMPLLVIYGFWWAISLLSCRPWHMIFSLVQFFLSVPITVNVVSIYAFCNIHDAPWDHEYISSKPVRFQPIIHRADPSKERYRYSEAGIDEAYDAHLRLLATRADSGPSPINEDNNFTNFRTMLILFWVFCNSVLVAVVLAVPGLSTIDIQPTGIRLQNSIIYIFWSVTAVVTIEFLGAVLFRTFGLLL